jgi:hypothetical protein
MVATFRLIKGDGHATHVENIRDVLLQLPRLALFRLDIDVQGYERGSCAPHLFSV